MLIVAGEYRVEPEHRDEFLRRREARVRTSRSESGCIDFVFSADPLDPGRVLLFEHWVSQEALDTHLSALRAQPPATEPHVAVLHREVVLYKISSSTPL
jgi:quinol monooxygenase YgiN